MWSPARIGPGTMVPGWSVRLVWCWRSTASRSRSASVADRMTWGGGPTRDGPAGVTGPRGDSGAGGAQSALAEDAPAAEPGAGHEDRAVADLAQVADGRPDDRGAMTEDGALAHPDGMFRRTDHHPVLQDGRVVADAHRSAVRAHHQALRQNRAGADVDLTQDYRRTGNLRLRLVNEHLIEAHGGLTGWSARLAPWGAARGWPSPGVRRRSDGPGRRARRSGPRQRTGPASGPRGPPAQHRCPRRSHARPGN